MLVLHVHTLGQVFDVSISHPGTLAEAIWLSGKFDPPALCSGLGRCGACRVRFLSSPPTPISRDIDIFDQTALEEGWRLACQHSPTADMSIVLPEKASPTQKTQWIKSQSLSQSLHLAVDLGTTTIYWQVLAHCRDQIWEKIGEGSCLNPQMGAGSDVISRLAYAKKDRKILRNLVLYLFRKINKEVTDHCKKHLDSLCIAGNTAMTSILVDADISGLISAPYSLPITGGVEVLLPDLPPAWIPPQLAPFVGGDISAAMSWLLQEKKFPFLLADLGTNGEFVLALDNQNSLMTSVPLGPSLEGIGLSLGGLAIEGNIDRFVFTPTGIMPLFIGTICKQGRICGTGYLSLLDILLRIGFLNRTGQIAQNPLAQRLNRQVSYRSKSWCLHLDQNLYVTGEDVEEILKVKAAFSLAFETLLREASLSSSDLASLELAGALGQHTPLDALENLGFLPQGLESRTHIIGNSSLKGASFLLRNPENIKQITDWSKYCRLIDLTQSPDFTQQYAEHMHF